MTLKLFLYGAMLAVAAATAAPVAASPAEDAVAAVTSILDNFNNGDSDAFITAHREGALIIDEFAPFLWGGAGSARRWLDAYGKDADARGISLGRVDYGKPIQANSDGSSAYVVLPTTYRFVQHGHKMSGAGSMTFVMARAGSEWKISSWTYSGAMPTPEK